jgi:hypothetical protein
VTIPAVRVLDRWQIADLRQLAIADPNTTLLELAIINVLDEFAEVVQNLAGNEPRGLGSV